MCPPPPLLPIAFLPQLVKVFALSSFIVMLFSTILSALAGVSLAFAAPNLVKRQSNATAPAPSAINDTQVLQYAMFLELLEHHFYDQYLWQFDEAAFAAAGYPSWVRGRFEQLSEHEATHVEFLGGALGSQALQSCEYSFPVTDPQSFVAVSMALETTGMSAYMGAAALLSDKNTLTAATTILAVEARQAAWVSSAVLKNEPWDGPFETPLGPNAIFSVASQFVVSCPSSNPPLPVVNLTALTVSPAAPALGSQITLNFTQPANVGNSTLYLAFLRGQNPEFSPITDSGNGTFTAIVPPNLQGTIWATVVTNNTIAATADGNILTGLAMLEFPFNSQANNNVTTIPSYA
ncbi:hypothetical protein EUX98_g1324 [Antrodiella citrinella]|uniref:Protein rds1 n=1 Tax=Antrodiella citrinella TaxID=2447956 RepID=A0A4S4N1R2_9APHY|nr:hypothetical protein EUX98_g1324 [Antrodiella citrinella]